jgi:hypothetical protein
MIFEGNELRVRAIRDIPIGTELTNDHESHKKTLPTNWNIGYNCALGEKGPVGPTGELLTTVIQLELKPLAMDSIQQEKLVA